MWPERIRRDRENVENYQGSTTHQALLAVYDKSFAVEKSAFAY